MRLSLPLLFLMLCFGSIAQNHPVFYAGLDLYRNTSFKDNVYGSFNVGAQVYQIGFFAPEVGYNYYAGWLPDREINKSNQNRFQYPDAIFEQEFSSSVLTLTPKLKFGKEDAFLVISPKYHIGNLSTRASYFVNDNGDGKFPLTKFQESKSHISYWSFAIGFEGLQISSKYWFALSLNYNAARIDDNWKALDFSSYNLKARAAGIACLGFGIRFYYDPFASEND
ncbi:hypothetical protein [Autumnicola musiva]|uniref:Outer membrane protein beta-barrel domain-containing protein n=1 Tax=Autumnicola musiva TaxID=3075589 RepID=A0ABU3D2B7_9FLAO|nr:hypothetical protein [Zunongwangia sp. F117]MDT0675685.1 hypothetical protein [Zunongwangia sp. F117]